MAGLISLGISAGPAPGLEIGQVAQPANVPIAAPAAADVREAEIGATGTPIFGGFLRELGEYNPNLTWPNSYMIYEEMRRSDAQVKATLMAIKLPIRCAEWRVHVPEDATSTEQEAADFVEDALMERLDFGAIMDNALLMLDFGASMSEDVYCIDKGMVTLKKVAARLPLTFYRWLCKPGTDELEVIEQLGYRAGQYIRTEVPMEKASLFTFQQEGANFTGISLLRSMYQHWYIKSGLYKVDAIACERNGMGVPSITMGRDVKKEDKEAALKWVQMLTTHQRTGIVLPEGWTFKLEGVSGTLRDPKDSIVHHNMMISMAGLAQFMVMGQGHSGGGNRSLGQTMSDFFYISLQATANHIARIISETTIKRLVDFNFTGIENYPKLVPQQILSVNFQDVVEALKELANSTVDAIRPDDDLEKWIRQKIGAPKAGEPRIRVSAPIPVPGTEDGPAGDTDPLDDQDESPAKPKKPAAAPAPAAPVPPAKKVKAYSISNVDPAQVHVPTSMGTHALPHAAQHKGKTPDSGLQAGSSSVAFQPARAARGPEIHLALHDIANALDKGRDDVAAALRAARPRIQAEIIHKLVDSPVRNMHRVSIAPDEKLISQIEDVLRGISDFGAGQVDAERDRQRAGRGPETAAKIRMAASAKRDPLGLYADGVVGEFTNNLQQRAANLALDEQRRGGKTKGDLITSIAQDLDDQSDRWIDNIASKGANEAFADGRADGYDKYKDEIASVIYSALLDLNTCPQCAEADGQSGTTPDDIPDVPNPDCDGGDKCRCVHVFVFSDEEPSQE